MGAVADFVEDVVGGVADAVTDVVEAVGDAVGKTIESAIDDPVGTLIKVAAVATGNVELLPLINGAETIAKGGDLGDALISAGASYVGGELGADIGAEVGSDLAGTAASGAITAGLRGTDPLQGAVGSVIRSGLNDAIGGGEIGRAHV